jgi:hypothetical protein
LTKTPRHYIKKKRKPEAMACGEKNTPKNKTIT